MADITILSQPRVFIPAYNENMYVVAPSGTNYLTTGYKMQVTVNVNGTNVATLQLPAHPNDGSNAANKVVFDARRIIENYVTYDLIAGAAGASSVSNSIALYYVTFQDVIDNTPTGTVVTSDTHYAWNAALSWYEYATYNSTNLPILDSAYGVYLTTPTTFNIQLNQRFTLYFLLSSVNVTKFVIKTYTNGTLVNTATYTMTLIPYGMFYFTCGTYDLNNLGLGTLIDSSITSYTIQTYFGTATYGPAITFNITQECRYDVVRLQFLNKWGGFDGFNFTKMSYQTVTPVRKQYKKVYGSVNGSNVWQYDTSETGATTYDTRYNVKYHLVSDWLTDADMQWLLELIHSPVIFIEVAAGSTFVYRAVNLQDVEYKVNKKQFEKVYNLEIDLTFTEDNFRQRQ